MMTSWLKFIGLLTLILLTGNQSVAQETNIIEELQIEYQWYPAGHIITANGEIGISKRDAITMRIGTNIARHRDLGKNDNEEGIGAGTSVGYRRYFRDHLKWLFVGARCDIWFNTIDWQNTEQGVLSTGETDIIVLQPTIAGGYKYVTKNDQWSIGLSLDLGFEFNVKEEGQPVGQGPISLLSTQIGFRW